MLVTQKKQYALRAIFELAKQQGEEPVKTSTIAEAQSIPLRFLEVIMGQLKRAGLVDSKRGFFGGYTLTRSPDQIRVGDIFRILDREDNVDACMACASKGNCPFLGGCVFMDLWDRALQAMDTIYDQTTIQTLIEQEARLTGTNE
ncbi:RrF2 family transcriptional regulator [Desulfosarcina ovata]|uniref:AsnC family transcriptional regulator n=2 Tax=Desulfosarcina ovata TaxID=83564 RepID=A0A5K8ACT9_9BACT|nr:Rrf2 family transcriptional regulator [Desulfosarcina ovata]BBO83878.1 AsnC family transcriptional regulator [Desulfosarcina ovata subsp. sediminis]BBO90371.1 AsnC family transcriptional regulator [Desulfosarcina ovata subsp. ovata]